MSLHDLLVGASFDFSENSDGEGASDEQQKSRKRKSDGRTKVSGTSLDPSSRDFYPPSRECPSHLFSGSTGLGMGPPPSLAAPGWETSRGSSARSAGSDGVLPQRNTLDLFDSSLREARIVASVEDHVSAPAGPSGGTIMTTDHGLAGIPSGGRKMISNGGNLSPSNQLGREHRLSSQQQESNMETKFHGGGFGSQSIDIWSSGRAIPELGTQSLMLDDHTTVSEQQGLSRSSNNAFQAQQFLQHTNAPVPSSLVQHQPLSASSATKHQGLGSLQAGFFLPTTPNILPQSSPTVLQQMNLSLSNGNSSSPFDSSSNLSMRAPLSDEGRSSHTARVHNSQVFLQNQQQQQQRIQQQQPRQSSSYSTTGLLEHAHNLPSMTGGLLRGPSGSDRVLEPNQVLPIGGPRSPVLSDQKPKTLYMPCDEDCLSEYQCLVRQQIEIFEAQQGDVESNAKGRNKPIFLGQVGIRCRHCSRLQPKQREKGAMYYPAKLDALYQAAQTMASVHFCAYCKHIPPKLREELLILKEKKSSAGGGKKYWGDGVRVLGVYEGAGGLRFKDNTKR